MPYLSKKYLNELYTKRRRFFDSTTINESYSTIKKDDMFDIFLSYSYSDKEYAKKIYALLTEEGFSVYIDLNDEMLDRNDTGRKTAKRLANIMDHCRSLIYVHTASAKVSKWCPWELGYMSGIRDFRCGIIPLLEDKEEFPHQEYLELYPVVDYEKQKNSSNYYFWANIYGTNKYVRLKEYINGSNPYIH